MSGFTDITEQTEAPPMDWRRSRRRRGLLASSTVLLDAVRVTLCLITGGLTGLFAFVAYYAFVFFADTILFIEYFLSPNDRYLYFSSLGGLLFFSVTLSFCGRAIPGSAWDILRQTIAAWILSVLMMLGILFLLKAGAEYSRGVIILWAMFGIPLFFGMRLLEKQIVGAMARSGFGRREIAIVGATARAGHLETWLRKPGRAPDVHIVGIFSDGREELASADALPAIAGNLEDLKRLSQRQHLDAIILACCDDEAARIQFVADELSSLPADLLLSPDAVQLELKAEDHSELGPLSVTRISKAPMRDWRGVAKWLEDMAIALLALAFVAPLLLVIAVAIKLDSPGPVLFRQPRFGFNNQKFQIYKFRTMHDALGDPSGAAATQRDDQRITRVGRFLRRTSLDELPQLLNVLMGDMSIVGPRAHPVKMRLGDRLINDQIRDYAARHRVKPGITGLAQVNGNRGEVTSVGMAEQRIRFDLLYIENWSVWMDLEIILRTALQVPFDRSAY